MDLEDNTGPVSSYSNCELSALEYSDCQAWQFTTYKYTELVAPISGSILETVRPNFEFNTPIGVSYITLKISLIFFMVTPITLHNPTIYRQY